MKLEHILLFIFSVIFIENFKSNKNIFYIFLNIISLLIFYLVTKFIIKVWKLESNNSDKIIHIGCIIKYYLVIIAILLYNYINRYNINNNYNKLLYYIIILNIIFISLSEISIVYLKELSNNKKIKKIITGILLFIVAITTPHYSTYGFYNNIYGFKNNYAWCISYTLINYSFIEDYKICYKIEWLLPSLISSIVPVIAHFWSNNNMMLYRITLLAITFLFNFYDNDFFYNEKLENNIITFYKQNDIYFLIFSIIIILVILKSRYSQLK
jgi:hypothetical protein